MIQTPKEGHVVEDFMIGNTHVKICDDCCRDKTPQDVEKILAQIAQNAYQALCTSCVPDVTPVS